MELKKKIRIFDTVCKVLIGACVLGGVFAALNASLGASGGLDLDILRHYQRLAVLAMGLFIGALAIFAIMAAMHAWGFVHFVLMDGECYIVDPEDDETVDELMEACCERGWNSALDTVMETLESLDVVNKENLQEAMRRMPIVVDVGDGSEEAMEAAVQAVGKALGKKPLN